MHSRSFSLDKLKSKVSRRSSSVSSDSAPVTNRRNSLSNPKIVITESISSSNSQGIRTQALSIHAKSRSRSNSRSTITPSPSKKDTKVLIEQEIKFVIHKKIQTFLQNFGLKNPINLKISNNSLKGPQNIKIYISNSNDCIFLPPSSSSSFTYEDTENGGRPDDTSSIETNRISNNPEHQNNSNNNGFSKDSVSSLIQSFDSPSYLSTKVDSDNPIPHTFALIIELEKEFTVKDLCIKFQSLVHILWPTGDSYNKGFVKEKFKIGDHEWKTSFSDADYYTSTLSTSNIKSKNLDLLDLMKRTKNYKLIDFDEIKDESVDSEISKEETTEKEEEFYTAKEGFYIFLVPILFPENIPPTIQSISGGLAHNFSVSFQKISSKLSRKQKINLSYDLPMIRTPPSFANSIVDKPIYVNRIWNDSLHYRITFPKKYVALGSEHRINLKLVPLVKDVVIKRIKFNVLERITYVSKSQKREYDYDGEDPYNLSPILPDGKIRERVVPVCELKTRFKSKSFGVEPYKEEVIKCPDNNLLFGCYEVTTKPTDNVLVASPLDINIALPFLTTRDDKFTQSNSGNNANYIQESDPDIESFVSPGHRDSTDSYLSKPRLKANSIDLTSSPKIGSLETNIQLPNISDISLGPHATDLIPNSSSLMGDEHGTSLLKENVHDGYTTLSKALYPDSNFRHVQITHRLQVSFRISKPDPNDHYKVHHYEVVVDTPLILLSAKCNEESVRLPQYNEIDEQFPIEIEDQPHPEVTFRTPNYHNNNGVTIRPLYDEDYVDQLPTFEQATLSPDLSTRSIFFEDSDPRSRNLSLIPSDPSPAYEYSIASKLSLNVSESTNTESFPISSPSPLIDDLNEGSPTQVNQVDRDEQEQEQEQKQESEQQEEEQEQRQEQGSRIEEEEDSQMRVSLIDEVIGSQADRGSSSSSNDSNKSASSMDLTSINNSPIFGNPDAQDVLTVGTSNSGISLQEQFDAPDSMSPFFSASATLSNTTTDGISRSDASTSPSTCETQVSELSKAENETEADSPRALAIGSEANVKQLIRPPIKKIDTSHSSIFTVDSKGIPSSTTASLNFDQSLQLLENYSVDEVNNSLTRLSTSPTNDKSDNVSILTADQMVPSPGQNFFHAY